jgi:adenine-specific DNA-methyltransferase
VTATRHPKDQRVNIPTAELESFARDDERHPKTVLYPRDPSLDPQLVWKGKDEQDQHDLAVPAVPIYIQEQIEPRAIIEDLRAQTTAGREQQLDLFSDFNGVAFEQRVDFYRHPMHWTNRLILGNSLHVMTSLAEKEGLKGQVQCTYVDPPYGIKFGSNWQVSTRKRDVRDGRAEDATRQPEQVQAFRDTWQLGIHSYLSYLRDRLVVARELLTESGSIFVQIGDENVHRVRALVDEVFGPENVISLGCRPEDGWNHRRVHAQYHRLRPLVRQGHCSGQVPAAVCAPRGRPVTSRRPISQMRGWTLGERPTRPTSFRRIRGSSSGAS